MVKIIAHTFIRKQSIEEAMPMFNILVEETRKEEGCIEYDLFVDGSDETHFVFIEEWETQQHLDSHMQSPHFKKYLPQLGELSDKSGDFGSFKRVF